MIQRLLFNNKVAVGISEINDGTMRYFGDGNESDVIERQKTLGKLISLDDERIARLRTTYEGRDCFTEYREIDDKNLSEYSVGNSERQIPVADGLVTKCSDIGFLLPLADCLGMVVLDEKHEILGLLHAGRHNIEQNGPKKFIEYLVNNYNSDVKNLKLFFSPYAINYQIYKLENKTMREATLEQLASIGVKSENIIDPMVDTVTSKNFPSKSGDDTDQRFAIIAKRCR